MWKLLPNLYHIYILVALLTKQFLMVKCVRRLTMRNKILITCAIWAPLEHNYFIWKGIPCGKTVCDFEPQKCTSNFCLKFTKLFLFTWKDIWKKMILQIFKLALNKIIIVILLLQYGAKFLESLTWLSWGIAAQRSIIVAKFWANFDV